MKLNFNKIGKIITLYNICNKKYGTDNFFIMENYGTDNLYHFKKIWYRSQNNMVPKHSERSGWNAPGEIFVVLFVFLCFAFSFVWLNNNNTTRVIFVAGADAFGFRALPWRRRRIESPLAHTHI